MGSVSSAIFAISVVEDYLVVRIGVLVELVDDVPVEVGILDHIVLLIFLGFSLTE